MKGWKNITSLLLFSTDMYTHTQEWRRQKMRKIFRYSFIWDSTLKPHILLASLFFRLMISCCVHLTFFHSIFLFFSLSVRYDYVVLIVLVVLLYKIERQNTGRRTLMIKLLHGCTMAPKKNWRWIKMWAILRNLLFNFDTFS